MPRCSVQKQDALYNGGSLKYNQAYSHISGKCVVSSDAHNVMNNKYGISTLLAASSFKLFLDSTSFSQ